LRRSVFKRQAAVVEKALVAAGWTVSINKDKPRKGAFVVTVDGEAKPSIELLGLPRPFTKLREYDLDAAVALILKK
jgi:hypothetical protein